MSHRAPHREPVPDEQLAIIMEYLWQHGVDKQRIKYAADAWYKIRQGKNK